MAKAVEKAKSKLGVEISGTDDTHNVSIDRSGALTSLFGTNSPDMATNLLHHCLTVLTPSEGAGIRKAKAGEFAANVMPIIKELQGQGLALRWIAATLIERGVKTARGGTWAATTVRNILARENQAEGVAE